jgi:hypothetical protein
VSVLFLALLAGCSTLAGRVRRHTYPPRFNYITQQQLHSAMWQIAHDVHELDQSLRVAPDAPPPPREHILELLTSIDEASSSLQNQGWPSNHPEIDANIATFRRDVAAASAAAMHEPPRYYLAGALSGACLYCHAEPR